MGSHQASATDRAAQPVRWPVRTVFLVGFALLSLGMVTTPNLRLDQRLPVLGCLAALGVVCFLWTRWQARLWPALERMLDEHTEAVDTLPDRHVGWWIA